MNWIKVTDKLPGDFDECWVYAPSMRAPEISTFWKGEFYFDNDDFDGTYSNITHWMRIVAPFPPSEL